MSRAGAAQGGGCSQCRSQAVSARRDCPATRQSVRNDSSRFTCFSPTCVADSLGTATLGISSDETIRERLKANAMSFRPTTLAVLTTGLIAAAGLTGCQVARSIRSFELRSFPWRRTAPQTRPHREHDEDQLSTETYVPGEADVPYPIPQQSAPQPSCPQQRLPQPVNPDQPRLRLPPEPSFESDSANEPRPIPVPPAVESDAPQARRWRPSQPSRPVAQGPQYTSQSETSQEEFYLPPARVTYNTEATTEEPATAPSPDQVSSSQPRLFRPAGSAKNLYDNMKRKLSR